MKPLDRALMASIALVLAIVASAFFWQLSHLNTVIAVGLDRIPPPLVLRNGVRTDGGRLMLPPEKPTVCRGEAVVWRPELESRRDTRVIFEAWVVPATPGEQMQSPAVALPLLVLPAEAGRVLRVTRRASTENLEPGDFYVLASVAPASPASALFYRIAFTVEAC